MKSVNALFELTAVVFCSASGEASWFDLVREGEVLGQLRRKARVRFSFQ